MLTAVIILNAANPSQVSSPSVIQFSMSGARRRCIVASGVAVCEYSTTNDSDVSRDTVIVQLGIPVMGIEQASVAVGLASIANDETVFCFAVDSAVVEVDGVTSQLQIRCQVAVRGDWSALHRFSYQAVVVAEAAVTRIAGRVRWKRSDLDITSVGNEVITTPQAFLRPAASKLVAMPSGNGILKLEGAVEVATGRIIPDSAKVDGDYWSVAYEIVDLPASERLIVAFGLGAYFSAVKGVPSQEIQSGSEPIVIGAVAREYLNQNYTLTFRKVN